MDVWEILINLHINNRYLLFNFDGGYTSKLWPWVFSKTKQFLLSTTILEWLSNLVCVDTVFKEVSDDTSIS